MWRLRYAQAAPGLEPASRAGEERRGLDRSSRLILLLALALLLLGVAQKAYRLSLPTEGFSTRTSETSDRPIFDANLLGQPSPLLPGDEFLALKGQIYETLADNARRLRPSGLEYRVGETVRYTVLREGREVTLEVPLSRWTAEGVAGAFLHSFARDFPGNTASALALLLAAYVFWRRPRNTTARLMLLFYVVALVVFVSRAGSAVSVADLTHPLPYWLAVVVGHSIYSYLQAPLLLHLCLTFPNPKPFLAGRPWLLGAVYALPWLAFLADALLGSAAFSFGLVGAYVLAGAVVLTHTFFTARDPVSQAQVRWFAFGFVVSNLFGLFYVLHSFGLVPAGVYSVTSLFPSGLVLTVCLAVAVLRYRLFDIDLLINRTLVYGLLSLCVAGVYVLVVGGLGVLFRAQGNLLFSLLATGLVAVLFQPLRERLQRAVNRLMYGERDEPYALLSRMGRAVQEALTPEKVLPGLLETLARALKLPYAGVVLYRDGGEELLARYGQAAAAPRVFPLTHQGETFGELHLEARAPEEPFTPWERHLLGTVAQQVSVAAYAVRQSLDLKRSRGQLISAREEERLRIRRDPHDGLGPTLAALNLQAGALHRLIRQDPAAAEEAATELRQELREAVAETRRLVYGLRPPSLDELGLVGALRQIAEGLQGTPVQGVRLPDIRLEAPSLPVLPPALEVAAYRIVQEALSNAVKHAQARTVTVALWLEPGELGLLVKDDGRGMPQGYRAGIGLRSMRERAEELGGSLELKSGAGTGTTVRARLPLPESN